MNVNRMSARYCAIVVGGAVFMGALAGCGGVSTTPPEPPTPEEAEEIRKALQEGAAAEWNNSDS